LYYPPGVIEFPSLLTFKANSCGLRQFRAVFNAPISELTYLRNIDLSYNKISDASVIFQIPNIVTVNLSHNRLKDLVIPRSQPLLQHLDVSNNPSLLAIAAYDGIIPPQPPKKEKKKKQPRYDEDGEEIEEEEDEEDEEDVEEEEDEEEENSSKLKLYYPPGVIEFPSLLTFKANSCGLRQFRAVF
ncbi:hypothetical protein ADUPG1_005893, partial [Aduncisulcus paluster]